MPNYNKSFNFKSGVQVDNDNFVVTPDGLVGIGTTQPRDILDVDGGAKVSGLTSTGSLYSTGISTFNSNAYIGAGITFDAATGTIYANAIIADTAAAGNVVAIATEGWVQTTSGLSTTSNVLITDDSTSTPLSDVDFQVVGLSSLSNLKVGVETATTLGVTGLTTTNNFDATGISTFGNSLHVKDGVRIGVGTDTSYQTIQIGKVFDVQEEEKTVSSIGANSNNIGINTNGILAGYKIKSDREGVLSTSQDTIVTDVGDGEITISPNTINSADVNSQTTFTFFSENRKQITTIKSDGTVGVGTTNPATGSILDVDGVADIEKLNISGLSTFSSKVYINSDLGIGIEDVNGNITNQSKTVAIAGTIRTHAISGSGTGLTNLNATNLSIGTVSNERLPNPITKQINVSEGISTFYNISSSGIITASQLVSNVANGTAPFTVTSTDVVTNLNADKLDGEDGTYYSNSGNLSGSINVGVLPNPLPLGVNTTGIVTAATLIGGDASIIKPDDSETDPVLQVVSENADKTARFSIGHQKHDADESSIRSEISYTTEFQDLVVTNKGYGDIVFGLHDTDEELADGISTGKYKIQYRPSIDDEPTTSFVATHDGKVAIGEDTFAEGDYKLTVNGTTKFGNVVTGTGATFTGVVTASSFTFTLPITFTTDQNLNTETGISTFNQISLGSSITQTINPGDTDQNYFSLDTTFENHVGIGSTAKAYRGGLQNSDFDIFNNTYIQTEKVLYSGKRFHFYTQTEEEETEDNPPGTKSPHNEMEDLRKDPEGANDPSINHYAILEHFSGAGGDRVDYPSQIIKNVPFQIQYDGIYSEAIESFNVTENTTFIHSRPRTEPVDITNLTSDDIDRLNAAGYDVTGKVPGDSIELDLDLRIGNEGEAFTNFTSKVGINTISPRAVLDCGGSGISGDRNLFIPPYNTDTTLTQMKSTYFSDSEPLSNRYKGIDVPRGSITYNTGRNQLQICTDGENFKNVNPVVAFGRVVEDDLQTGSFNASYTSTINNSGPDITRITFSTALPNANYVVVYSHENDGNNTANVTNILSAQTTEYFEITWGRIDVLKWHFSVLQL